MGKVILYSSRSFNVGGTSKKLHTFDVGSVSTWGELQDYFRENSVDISGMKAIIAENKMTMESSEAILPFGQNIGNIQNLQEFTLMLTPTKVSSGYDDDDDDFSASSPTAAQQYADYIQSLEERVGVLESRVDAIESNGSMPPDERQRMAAIEQELKKFQQSL